MLNTRLLHIRGLLYKTDLQPVLILRMTKRTMVKKLFGCICEFSKSFINNVCVCSALFVDPLLGHPNNLPGFNLLSRSGLPKSLILFFLFQSIPE